MSRVFLKKKLIKALAFGILFVLMSALLVGFAGSEPLCATEFTNEEGASGSNEDSDTTKDYVEGELGGLTFRFDGDNTSSLSATLQILLILTVLSLAPSILICLHLLQE